MTAPIAMLPTIVQNVAFGTVVRALRVSSPMWTTLSKAVHVTIQKFSTLPSAIGQVA